MLWKRNTDLPLGRGALHSASGRVAMEKQMNTHSDEGPSKANMHPFSPVVARHVLHLDGMP